MKRNRSKRSFAATVTTLSIVALLLVGMTLAFLTDSRSTLNILGIGSDNGGGGTKTIQVALLEEKFGSRPDVNAIEAQGRLAHEYTKVVLDDVLPGDEINKDSVVKNVGRKDIYVRVLLLDQAGNSIDFDQSVYEKLELSINTDQLVAQEADNGHTYYYYGNGTSCLPLEPNETVDVFETFNSDNGDYTIKVDETVANSDLSIFTDGVGINVVVEAIQADNFVPGAIIDGADVWNGQVIEDIAGNIR